MTGRMTVPPEAACPAVIKVSDQRQTRRQRAYLEDRAVHHAIAPFTKSLSFHTRLEIEPG